MYFSGLNHPSKTLDSVVYKRNYSLCVCTGKKKKRLLRYFSFSPALQIATHSLLRWWRFFSLFFFPTAKLQAVASHENHHSIFLSMHVHEVFFHNFFFISLKLLSYFCCCIAVKFYRRSWKIYPNSLPWVRDLQINNWKVCCLYWQQSQYIENAIN